MKKFIALFLALVLALGLMACASSATTETTTQPAETTTTTEETKTEEAAPAEETSEETAPAAAGSVYWLNFKPESELMEEEVKASKPSSAARAWMSSATVFSVSKLVMSVMS